MEKMNEKLTRRFRWENTANELREDRRVDDVQLWKHFGIWGFRVWLAEGFFTAGGSTDFTSHSLYGAITELARVEEV